MVMDFVFLRFDINIGSVLIFVLDNVVISVFMGVVWDFCIRVW